MNVINFQPSFNYISESNKQVRRVPYRCNRTCPKCSDIFSLRYKYMYMYSIHEVSKVYTVWIGTMRTLIGISKVYQSFQMCTCTSILFMRYLKCILFWIGTMRTLIGISKVYQSFQMWTCTCILFMRYLI